MNCPNCMNYKIRCLDSRPVDGTIRRRRACRVCDARWTTYEITHHEATGFYEHNPPFEEPLKLMRLLADLTKESRKTAYRVIEALLARQALDQIKGKDAA